MADIRKRDKIICKNIKTSIGNIVRFSLNEEFRYKCFTALGVDNTHSCEQAAYGKLMDVCSGKAGEWKHGRSSDKLNHSEPNENIRVMEAEVTTPQHYLATPTNESPTMLAYRTDWLAIAASQARFRKRKSEEWSMVSQMQSAKKPRFFSEPKRSIENEFRTSQTHQSPFEWSPAFNESSNFSFSPRFQQEPVDLVRRALFSDNKESSLM